MSTRYRWTASWALGHKGNILQVVEAPHQAFRCGAHGRAQGLPTVKPWAIEAPHALRMGCVIAAAFQYLPVDIGENSVKKKHTDIYWPRIKKSLTSDKTDILSWGFCLDFSTGLDIPLQRHKWAQLVNIETFIRDSKLQLDIRIVRRSDLNGKIRRPVRFPRNQNCSKLIYIRRCHVICNQSTQSIKKHHLNKYPYTHSHLFMTVPVTQASDLQVINLQVGI
jgi:hypothetical protein